MRPQNESADRLAHADTSPDLRHELDADAPASEPRPRRASSDAFVELIELANEAHEKELGCLRLCALASQVGLSHEFRQAMDKRAGAAQRRVDSLRSLGHLLGFEVQLSTYGALRRAAARHRIAGMVEAVQMAIDARELSLAESVARECVMQARMMAEMTWRALRHVARGVHLEPGLRGSAFDTTALELGV
jgi:hypothetical protein